MNATTSLEDGPLTGLRVVEFGQLIAGPWVGTLLGDFGADVIKVEAPPKGDALREWGRHRHNDHSLWWSVMARGKRSVALNLRTDDCRARALELCSIADVVVENFRPGTMEKWGLGPDDVHAVNPGCVYARVSGYGQTGQPSGSIIPRVAPMSVPGVVPNLSATPGRIRRPAAARP